MFVAWVFGLWFTFDVGFAVLVVCVAGLVLVCAWCDCGCVGWLACWVLSFFVAGFGIVLEICGCLFVLSLLCVVVLLFHA